MELEVSKKALAAYGLVFFLTALALLGWTVTPVTGDGTLLVLSPAYVATMRYLKSSQSWLDELAGVDDDLVHVVSDEGNFYTQGRSAEKTFEIVVSIAREIEQAKTPPALLSLQTALRKCAASYVMAARAVLAYVSAPSEENRQVVDQRLVTARKQHETCIALQEGMWPAH